MSKRGRKCGWIEQLDAGQRESLERAADSGVRHTAESLFSRFGLEAFGVPFRTFQHWLARRRQDNRERRLETPSHDEPAPEWEEIDRRARLLALRHLDSGDPKIYELVLLMRSRRERDELGLKAAAEKRAAELHDVKLAELRKAQEAALEGASKSAQLTPEQVSEIRRKVLGLA